MKNVKKKTAQELVKLLRSNRAPPCRFLFYHIVELVLENKNVKIRKRGKEIVDVTADPEHYNSE